MSIISWFFPVLICVFVSCTMSLAKLGLVFCGCVVHIQSLDSVSIPSYFPWLGKLVKKETESAFDEYDMGKTTADRLDDEVTHVIIIRAALGVGTAESIARWDPKPSTTEVRLWSDSGIHSCAVKRYLLHPEHSSGRTHMPGLIYLAPLKEGLTWQPIPWPKTARPPNPAVIVSIIKVNDTDNQYWKDVVLSDKEDCIRFYIPFAKRWELLNSAEYSCYVAHDEEQCTYSPNMALVHRSEGNLELFGIGIRGSGCSAPSRWLHFRQFTPWILDTLDLRRRSDHDLDHPMYDYYEDLDLELMSRDISPAILENKHLVEIIGEESSKSEIVLNKQCNHSLSSRLIYREDALIYSSDMEGRGTYALSVIDDGITCVELITSVAAKSRTRWWVTTGFRQEDVKNFISLVPVAKPWKDKSDKVVVLVDWYRRLINETVVHLEFQFSFVRLAKLFVDYYGLPGVGLDPSD